MPSTPFLALGRHPSEHSIFQLEPKVCDNIDARHKTILPDYVWGEGTPAKVNQRAAEEMKNTARAAKKLGVSVVNGFTAIYINGVYQNRNTYTVTNGTVTFSQAPPYTSIIEVVYN